MKEPLINPERSKLRSECSDSRRKSRVIAGYCEDLQRKRWVF